MPRRFKDRKGHTRFQEAKKDLKEFFEKNGDTLSAVTKGIAKVAVPRVAHVIDAIDEVKRSSVKQAVKDKAIEHLENLVNDLDDDDAPDTGYPAAEPTMPVIDASKLVSSTFVSKYLGAATLLVVALIFAGMWITEIGFYWGLVKIQVPAADKATISAVFMALFGIRQISRADMKKKIIQTIT